MPSTDVRAVAKSTLSELEFDTVNTRQGQINTLPDCVHKYVRLIQDMKRLQIHNLM